MKHESFFSRCVYTLRYAVRQLWKTPGFSLTVLATLALGLGVNIAIFALTENVLLKSLPVRAPHELFGLGDAVLNGDTNALQDSFTLYSYPLYKHLRDHTTGVSGIAAFQSWLATVSVRPTSGGQQQHPAKAEYVSGNYFEVLGINAVAGRVFTQSDDESGALPVAVVSYAEWARQGFKRELIGANVIINGVAVTIVGIAPPEFFGETLRTEPPDYWLPLALEEATTADNPLLHKDDIFWLYAFARVKCAINLVGLQNQVKTEIRRWIVEHHLVADRDLQRANNLHLSLTPASGGISGLQRVYGDALKLLTVLSAFVLLIACVNIANLFLARGAARGPEMAVRVALGASRRRLVAETMTEALALAICGGAAGLLIGVATSRMIVTLVFRAEDSIPFSTNPSVTLVGYTFGVAVITGILFSVIPAWRGSNPDPAEALRAGGRGTSDIAMRPQRWLIIAQAGFSFVLLVGAGLLTVTLRQLEQQPLGFSRGQVIIVSVNPALDGYTADGLPALYRKLDEQLQRTPGVLSASYALHAPLDDWNWGARLRFEGRAEPTSAATEDRAQYTRISSHYFETIGTRVLRGRAIDEHDTTFSPRVAVVNESFATRFFPHSDPIGRHFGLSSIPHNHDFEIVGIVEDAKYRDLRQPAEPMFFLPLTQTVHYNDARLEAYQKWSLFIDGIQLRMSGSVAAARPVIQRAIANIDPDLTILRIRPMNGYVDAQLSSPRLLARLTTLYGALALVLACVGLYGVTSYTFARRRRELGVLIALGATRPILVVGLCRQALVPVVIGILLGIPAMILGDRTIGSQLYGVASWNGLIVVGASTALLGCSLLAALIPARRVASIDPLQALRSA
jgi:predicted permease